MPSTKRPATVAAATAAIVAALVSLTACGGSGGGDGMKPVSAPHNAPPARKSFDPPHTFGNAGVGLPNEANQGNIDMAGRLAGHPPISLFRTTAYVASADRLQAVDTTTGRVRATVEPQRKPLGNNGGTFDRTSVPPPVIADFHGKSLVVMPFLVQIPSSGTTPSGTALEMVYVNAENGTREWRTETVLPAWAGNSFGKVTTAVVSADRGIAVVRVSDDEHGITYAVSLDTRQTLWQKDLAAAAAADGVVTALDPSGIGAQQHLKGFDLATGESRWSTKDASYESSIQAAAPHLLAFSGRDYGSGHGFTRFLDPRTGEVKGELPNGTYGLDCLYDGKSATLCGDPSADGQLIALDASSAQPLWQLPDKNANRVAPRVSAVWNGVVYGTTGNGPVALDSRTGADAKTSPGIAPVLVNGYTGIALDKDTSTLKAYPTTG
ncbi:PQQ-binding-like beta-propeller repeat protein [Streptomyces sp. NPDC052396]|uniref:outer membrane protein assembly factor BamB family protein n=1 Tax=Streptomyces sp. NPDC052396 TaxID=3365689 RepID=UPI0037D6830D